MVPGTSDFEKQIRVAQGYVELGMFADASAELEGIDRADRDRPEVLACRTDIHCGLGEWDQMLVIASQLAREAPKKIQWQVTLAHAARYARSVDAARNILLDAVERMPNEAILQYNLACYECLLGETEVAKARLRHAFKLDPTLRAKGRQDEDLASLRHWL